jgi:hypothetical protein
VSPVQKHRNRSSFVSILCVESLLSKELQLRIIVANSKTFASTILAEERKNFLQSSVPPSHRDALARADTALATCLSTSKEIWKAVDAPPLMAAMKSGTISCDGACDETSRHIAARERTRGAPYVCARRAMVVAALQGNRNPRPDFVHRRVDLQRCRVPMKNHNVLAHNMLQTSVARDYSRRSHVMEA